MSVEPDTEPLVQPERPSSDGKAPNMGHQAYVPPDFDTAGESSRQPLTGSLDESAGGSGGDNPPSYSRDASGGIFSFGFYMRFFDVETRQVMERCLYALNPFEKTQFLADDEDDIESGVTRRGMVAGGNGTPDLYGPFWICTTVVFVLFFSSTLTGLLFSSWQGKKYEYKFDLLTGAAGLMYSYTFLIPLGMWLILRYLNIAPNTTLLQLVALYGYSNVIWIPVAILSVSPLLGVPRLSNIIRWIFIILGFAVSASFIGKNIFKKLLPEHNQQASDRKSATVIFALAIALHVGLAFAVKMLFFSGIKVKD
ncbi:protein Yip5p [Trichomonascus vanleenenianus]|uniref:Yip5p n=1 Tax=Trichomonascus vanleenenianus TaxID=2268995 RepID=UPI003ECA4F08